MDSFFANWKWADKRLNRWILSISMGILLAIAWPINGFPFLSFFAFLPLLILDHKLRDAKRGHFFIHIYNSFLIWNVFTTWWVFNSTPVAILAFTANSALQYLPILAYRITAKRANQKFAYLSLPIYWISFEYLHLSWQLSWPWLTLGNVFSEYPEVVQWYEFTGVLGGSIWILVINILLFQLLNILMEGKSKFPRLRIIYLTVIILAPIIESIGRYSNYEQEGQEYEVIVVQPNIDPYSEKFEDSPNFIPFVQQVQRLIDLSESKLTDKTKFLLWPETAIDNQFEEGAINDYPILRRIRDFKNNYPNLTLLTGLTTYQYYEEGVKSESARFSERYNLYYDVYNAGMFVNERDHVNLYHKSKLVPGVEILPYPSILGFLKVLSFDLGGTSGGFGRQKERTVFKSVGGVGFAPAICYESIYGDFLSAYVRNGANFIGIITNDGWWGNTAGYKQHNSYARLRAIEFRRDIARSANTGISGFVNQRGDELAQSEYWEQDVILGTINANTEITVYARLGDYLGRVGAFVAVAMLLSAMVRGKTSFRKKSNHG